MLTAQWQKTCLGCRRFSINYLLFSFQDVRKVELGKPLPGILKLLAGQVDHKPDEDKAALSVYVEVASPIFSFHLLLHATRDEFVGH